jgi:hypothetical protein
MSMHHGEGLGATRCYLGDIRVELREREETNGSATTRGDRHISNDATGVRDERGRSNGAAWHWRGCATKNQSRGHCRLFAWRRGVFGDRDKNMRS